MGRTLLVLVCCLAVFLQGCASIFCGSTKTISVKSEPSDVDFTIKDKTGLKIHEGKTPEMVTLKRGAGYFEASDYTVEFTDGVNKDVLPIKSDVEWGWYLGGNILFGGLIGWFIVDPITGGMYNIHDVSANLNFIPAVDVKTGKKILGYQVTRDQNGKSITTPVYEQ